MDLRKIEDITEVYNYWQSLIKTMPDGYDLAYKILGVSVNDKFDAWSQEDKKFDRITELAAQLEAQPDNTSGWEEIKKLIG
jgi:hypothetical protein